MRDGLARLKGDRYLRRAEDSPDESAFDKLTRETIWRVVTPRWRRHLERLVERERPDAVVVFTVPMAHFRGIPTALRERFGIPVVFYDGDVPMSLPEFGGMDTGFNYYHGADPSEYDLVLSNSEGGLPRLLELGARRAEAVFWGADPEFFAPQPVAKEMDVFFYGYGDKFRREWTAAMVGEPSRAAPEIDFALGGRDFRGDAGSAREIGDVPFNVFARAISAARINLNVTRRSHATVPLSSTCRPFELASAGAAIVSNPHEGIEQWFEPGSEIVVVEDADAGARRLPGARSTTRPQAAAMGARARERVLDEHTYAHRARRRARPARARARGARCEPTGDVIAIVPAYNEEAAIGGVVDEIRASTRPSTSSSIDDGSRDATAAVARAHGARRASASRSTSASAAPSRPGSSTPSSTATSGGAARRRRPARSGRARASCSTPIDARRGRHRHGLAIRRRRRPTVRRSPGGSGSSGSRGSSRCSPASG